MDSSSEQHATLQSTSDRQVQVKLEGGSEEDAKREDVITLIEQDLSLLLRILTSSIHYISTRSSMVQLSDSIPLSRPTGAAGAYANSNMVERATMKESIDELTDDLIQKAKDIETLVDRLPVTQDEEAFQRELQGLDEEMKVANEEYRSALQEAKELKAQVDVLLKQLCDDHQSTRAALANVSSPGSSSSSSSHQQTNKEQSNGKKAKR